MKASKFIKYGAYFTIPKFFAFVKRYGHNLIFIRKALTLFFCMRDKETPNYVKAVIVGALGYMIVPNDAMPDVIAGIGWLDDLAVLTVAFKIAGDFVKPSHQEAAKKFFPFGKDEG